MNASSPTQELRLDKWLWAARFFKTRQLAIEAINGGKIQVDGQRAKPSRSVRPGSRIEIHKGSLSWRIEVLAVDKQRRSATEASKLYAEDEESRLKREEMVRERRDMALGQHDASGRPSKRDRRMIQRFTGRGDPTP
ncbi:RNA-binding S4 domain-containing protein [Imhoffiella purpurea]|uniref:Heat shock protein 15 n=1 Tax=Imhoffiella purpurea TaxID=1249627 RepID=W9VIC6_9GAMM|nr:S4 domain-containing protein [Imhoffiella purpurea]EXJ16776.1 Ribosome-associated heat shock protein [Imhoffiella purpurea]